MQVSSHPNNNLYTGQMHNFSFVSSANAPVHPNLAEMLQTKPWRILYVRGPQRKVNNLLSNLAESPCNLQLNKITSDYTSPTLNQTSHAPINSMQNQAEERLAVFGIEPQEITLNYKKLKDVPPLMRARCYVAEFMDSNVAIISFFQMKGLKDRFFIAKRLRAYVDKHELYNIVITCYDKMDAIIPWLQPDLVWSVESEAFDFYLPVPNAWEFDICADAVSLFTHSRADFSGKKLILEKQSSTYYPHFRLPESSPFYQSAVGYDRWNVRFVDSKIQYGVVFTFTVTRKMLWEHSGTNSASTIFLPIHNLWLAVEDDYLVPYIYQGLGIESSLSERLASYYGSLGMAYVSKRTPPSLAPHSCWVKMGSTASYVSRYVPREDFQNFGYEYVHPTKVPVSSTMYPLNLPHYSATLTNWEFDEFGWHPLSLSGSLDWHSQYLCRTASINGTTRSFYAGSADPEDVASALNQAVRWISLNTTRDLSSCNLFRLMQISDMATKLRLVVQVRVPSESRFGEAIVTVDPNDLHLIRHRFWLLTKDTNEPYTVQDDKRLFMRDILYRGHSIRFVDGAPYHLHRANVIFGLAAEQVEKEKGVEEEDEVIEQGQKRKRLCIDLPESLGPIQTQADTDSTPLYTASPLQSCLPPIEILDGSASFESQDTIPYTLDDLDDVLNAFM